MDLNVVNDTVIMALCSQPCDFLFYADSGLCAVCICGPPLSTGISGAPGAAVFGIHPNPVSSKFPMLTVEQSNDGSYHAQVMDHTGRTLMSRTMFGGNSRLDLSAIPQGNYLLLLHASDGRTEAKRFVIE